MQQQQPKSKGFFRRLVALGTAVVLLFAVFIFRLYQWQVVEHEEHYSNARYNITYSFTVPAARGDIVDRYGRVLATNTPSSSLVLNKLFLPDAELNDTLLALTEILAGQGEEWMDSAPVSAAAPWQFTGKAEDGTDGAAANAMKRAFGKQNYATADQVVEAAIAQYGLQEYSEAEQRTLLGLRYTMQAAGYSTSTPFTIAEDVSEKTVALVSENTRGLSGIEVHEVSKRVYNEGTAIPHVMGIVGLISAEEWAADSYALRENGYAMDGTIGKFGLELAFESSLRGQDGVLEVVRSSDGVFVSEEMTQQPQAGETLVLTIDLEFQLQLQELLANYIDTLQGRDGTENAEGGAIVVLDVKNGGVLGYANYPSYDINDYYSSYAELVGAELNPMYNRAFQQLYRPGSTFKPVVALAGLAEGEIAETSTVQCTGTYTYYTGYSPGCLGTHGNINVRNALQHSCNIFFYDVGRRLGEGTYNAYAEALGLGVATGVEVAENVGYLTSPETSEKLGGEWYPANVVQGAIGQLDTVVTPVQLATYAATLANNGTRYATHLVSGLRSSGTGAQTTTYGAEVLSEIEADEAFQIVREGMIQASKYSNYGQHLGDWDGLTIASKTGSPQVTVDETNGVIIAYGPVEDAEIAVAIVVENGANGYRLAELMRQVFDCYAGLSTGSLSAPAENQLLA